MLRHDLGGGCERSVANLDIQMTSLEILPVSLVAIATVINWRWARHLQRTRYALEEQDLLQRALWLRRLDAADAIKAALRAQRDEWKIAKMHSDAVSGRKEPEE